MKVRETGRQDETSMSTPVSSADSVNSPEPQATGRHSKHRSPRGRSVATGPRSARRGISWLWLAGIAVLTAAAVALAVFSALWVLDVRSHDASNDRRNAVAAATSQTIDQLVNLSGKDQASAEKQLNALIANSTGSFRSQFATDVPGEAKLFAQAKAVSVGKIDAVGVNTVSSKAATATVAAEANITNSQTPKGKVTYYKMTVALEKVKGRWLVSSVGFVP
jgi:Mce-associated membrane protein